MKVSCHLSILDYLGCLFSWESVHLIMDDHHVWSASSELCFLGCTRFQRQLTDQIHHHLLIAMLSLAYYPYLTQSPTLSSSPCCSVH